jgi:hypothetical protein
VGVALSPTGDYTTAVGESNERARREATILCSTPRAICTDALAACDETPTAEPESPSHDGGVLGDPSFWRMVLIARAATYGGTAIVLALSLWLFVTVLSTADPGVLKRRAAIFAWLALPSLPICAGWALIPNHAIPGGVFGLALLCWTLVFAALSVGTLIQSDRKNAPDVLSLPIAALLFSIITFGLFAAFIEYGLLPSLANCDEPIRPLSLCDLSRLEGLYFSVGAIVILIFMGIFLSADSHVIRMYARFRRSASTIKGIRLRGVVASKGLVILSLRSALIALSYVAAIIGGVALAAFLDPVRLWRESRINVFEIAAIATVCILAIGILFLLRKVHGLQRLLTASPERRVVGLRTEATDRPANAPSGPALAWDPGAIKDVFKRKRREFEV